MKRGDGGVTSHLVGGFDAQGVKEKREGGGEREGWGSIHFLDISR